MSIKKRLTSIVLAGVLTFQAFAHLSVVQASTTEVKPSTQETQTTGTQTSEVQTAAPKLTLKSDTPVTAGVLLRKYDWSSTRSSGEYTTEANVIVIDLKNPHVKVDVMTAGGKQFHSKKSVLNMAAETGAVAGVNGDFFHMQLSTPPLGPQISNSQMMASPSPMEGWYTFGITHDNKPIIDRYIFQGTVSAANGTTFELAGLNRPAQWTNGVHSHVGKIHLYTSAWGQLERGYDTHYTPMEILVVDDVVMGISEVGEVLPMMVPENGYILRSNGAGTVFVNNNIKVGDTLNLDYTMNARDPLNKEDTNSFKMMIGGHTLLVQNGEASAFSLDVTKVDGFRSRSGVGYSQDGRYVYLITVDNNGSSKGMNFNEFQQFMVKLGIWKGMNLDGGGSATLVSRPLGETQSQLTNRTEFGSQRSVVNGIGVYSTAPVGRLAGFIIKGKTQLFLKEAADYQLKAYDTYFNPFQTNAKTLNWSALHGVGTIEENVFTANKVGKETIQASNGTVKEQVEVNVIGREQLSSLKIDSPPIVLREAGEIYKLPVVASTKTGMSRMVPPQSIDWEIIGFDGDINGNTLTVHKLPESGFGQMIARYNGFSTMIKVSVGTQKLWADFDNLTYDIEHNNYPDEVTGRAWVVSGFQDKAETDNALFITYNFTEGTGNKASYAEINGPEGVLIEGEPQRMNMEVLGDNSGSWLRTEVWDAKGTLQRIDINRNVNWYGWQPVSVDLAPYNLAYPITMKHIYIASPWDGQDKRDLIGQMAIDNISFDYVSKAPKPERKLIHLTIDQKSLSVNGQTMELDQAPILEKGTTLVPIRFVVDALGGTVAWDDKTQKVTVESDGNLMEMWIGNADINVNGRNITALMPPRIENQRTLVPVRVISEQMGRDVSWDQETKTVTIQ